MKFLQWGIYIALDNDDYEVPADLLSDKLTSLILKELDNLKSKEKLLKLKNTNNETARNLWQKGGIMKILQKIINFITFYRRPKKNNYVWLHIEMNTKKDQYDKR